MRVLVELSKESVIPSSGLRPGQFLFKHGGIKSPADQSSGLWFCIDSYNRVFITTEFKEPSELRKLGPELQATPNLISRVPTKHSHDSYMKARSVDGGLNLVEGDTGDIHARLHALDSALDHAPASVENYGKYLRANPNSGSIEFNDIPTPLGLVNIPLSGYSSYITLGNYGLSPGLSMVSFLKPAINSYQEIEVHYQILEDGRLFYNSSFDLTGSVVILKQ